MTWSTYLGGANTDHAAGVAVDSSGAVWVAGSTWSSDFPIANAYQGASGGGQDAFVSKFSADGNTLPMSTYLGGSGGTNGFPEAAQAIALDSQGNAYVAGVTSSPNFPTLNPAQSSLSGPMDAFVTKFGASGGLVYSTYLGGSGADVANAIAVDASDTAYVAGYTYSTDLPVVNAIQTANGGGCDAFLAALGATGAIGYLSYLGGSGSDAASGVATNSGAVYVAGWTMSANFPLQNAFQSTDSGNYAAFIAKMNLQSSGSAPVVLGVTPNTGAGTSQTFSLQVWDSGGASSLTSVTLLFNSTTLTTSACAVVYNGANGALSLLTDSGGQGVSTSPGSGLQVNAQCILSGSRSSVSAVGSILTIDMALTFRTPFVGSTNIYAEASDALVSTGWQRKGAWTVPAYSLTQVAPADASTLTSYVNATTYVDFSGLQDVNLTSFPWRTYWNFGDSTVTMSFFSTYGGTYYLQDIAKLTTPGPWYGGPYDPTINPTGLSWNVWPQSQRTSSGSIPIFEDGSPAVVLQLSRPVATLGFEAEPPFSTSATITAVFLRDGVPDLPIGYSGISTHGGSHLFAATGGNITGVAITTDDYYCFVGAVRYSLTGTVGDELGGSSSNGASTATNSSSAAANSPAAITSPVNGSSLTSASVVFQWSAGVGVSEYRLSVSAISPGGSELYAGSAITGASASVTNLPLNGATLYARLYSLIDGAWSFLDFTYTAAASAAAVTTPPSSSSTSTPALTSPSGAVLSGTSVTFQWTSVGASEYWLNVSAVAAGGTDLYNASAGTNTSVTVHNLPTTRSVFVRLWWKTGSTWRYLDYSFKAANSP